MRKQLLFGILMSLILVLTACGGSAKKPSGGNIEHDGHADHGVHTASGDLQEETASARVLPSFLDSQSDDIRLVYAAAGQAADVLEWIPCYCGCGDSVGHKSSLNCFIAEIKEDGSVIWDDHGTRCGVCLKIAAQSMSMKQEGKTNLEIRNFIDETYKKGFAAPTDTKMPTA
ncbi:PCYCGC motif-containing (lipo)protein [Paenibacillus sp. NPDC058071]|uniref:PCYCGC motif-containing (lipo)protein n=1 Tax=Paenibacillus sp. NPDC058071 TaxID=3346326 RepID=UPI0036DC20C3